MKISELAGLITTGSITISGRAFQIRSLPASLHADIIAALPEPEPQFSNQPVANGGHALLRNLYDPAYTAGCELVRSRRAAVIAGVALGLEDEKGLKEPPKDAPGGTAARIWAEAYAKMVMDALPDRAIDAIIKECYALGAMVEGKALGKSSSPTPNSSPPPPTSSQSPAAPTP